MKILHFAAKGIPDKRIEKYAYLQRKDNHYLIFCGRWFKKYLRFPDEHLFDEFYELKPSRMTLLGIEPFFSRYKRKFQKFLKIIKPDVVHAHDLFPAKVCSDLNIPFIYDDREYWSLQAKFRSSYSLTRKLSTPIIRSKHPSWEKDVLNSASAIITVSNTICQDHQRFADHVFSVPNFLSAYEIERIPSLQQSDSELDIVVNAKANSPYEKKVMVQLSEVLNRTECPVTIIGKITPKIERFQYLGYVPPHTVFQILSKFHIGLTEIARRLEGTGYLPYVSPNRIFEFLNCGVTPLISTEMKYLVNLLGDYARVYTSEEELLNIISDLKSDYEFLRNQPVRVKEFAGQNLVWDKYKPIIQRAYEIVNT